MISRQLTLLALMLLTLAPLQLRAASSAVTVTQSSSAHGSISKGAQRVPFLELRLAASCAAAVTVQEVTIVHDGLGEADDLARVYAMDGRRRLTRSRTFDASDLTTALRFVPALTIDACDARSITIMADIARDAEAAGEHRLFVELPTDILTNGSVTLKTQSTTAPATVRPSSTGSVDATFLDLLQPLRFGEDRTLARIRFSASGENDQEIHSILLTNDGKARDADLENLFLKNQQGTIVSETAASLEGDTVTLTFDPPLLLRRNSQMLFELKGDIRASKRRTVRFVLEETADLQATPARRR